MNGFLVSGYKIYKKIMNIKQHIDDLFQYILKNAAVGI